MPETPQLDVGHRLHEATEALAELRHAGDRAALEMARRLDLTLNDLHAMEHVMAGEELGPAEIARRLDMTTASATALVDRLEGRGHVVRTQVAGDRRRRAVHVTPSGQREAFAVLRPLVSALDEAADGLTDAEHAVVVAYLRRVTEAYEAFCSTPPVT